MKKISLLHRNGLSSQCTKINNQSWLDLEIDVLLEKIDKRFTKHSSFKSFFLSLYYDKDILSDRQDVMEDLLVNPGFLGDLEKVAPVLEQLRLSIRNRDEDDSAMTNLINTASNLNRMIEITDRFSEIFARNSSLKAGAWNVFKREIDNLRNNEEYNQLKKILPQVMNEIRKCRSVTIGLNLDEQLRPVEAALLSVQQDWFQDTYKTYFNTVMGTMMGNGTTPLTVMHKPPVKQVDHQNMTIRLTSEDAGYLVDPFLLPLFQDLRKLLKGVARPLIKKLEKFQDMNGLQYLQLAEELPILLGVVRFLRNQRENGIPVCRPSYSEYESSSLHLKDCINPLLAALSENESLPVASDLSLNSDTRFMLITGPNRGGKSIFLQAVGLNILLALWGFPVLASFAEIPLFDQLLTHFPSQDKMEDQSGRLGEECQRFRSLLEEMTTRSLLLMNESFSTTHETEGTYIAEEILRALSESRICGLFVTHMHELASRTGVINNEIGFSYLGNLIAKTAKDENEKLIKLYKVVAGQPEGKSYAMDIAKKYGLWGEDLKKIIK